MGRQLRRSSGTLLILLLFVWGSGVAQTPARPTGTLTVFVAASLTELFAATEHAHVPLCSLLLAVLFGTPVAYLLAGHHFRGAGLVETLGARAPFAGKVSPLRSYW
jgi:ABC-type sulfate transport system permease component